jgi:hypothetical protein
LGDTSHGGEWGPFQSKLFAFNPYSDMQRQNRLKPVSVSLGNGEGYGFLKSIASHWSLYRYEILSNIMCVAKIAKRILQDYHWVKHNWG